MPKKKSSQALSPRALWKFTAYVAALIDSGYPLVQALDSMKMIFADEKEFAKAIAGIREDISNGATFANALKNFPQYFDDFYVAMVYAGEMGGILDTVMNRASDFLLEKIRMQENGLSKEQYDKLLFLFLFPMLIACGVPILDNLNIIAQSVKDKNFAKKIRGARRSISEGRSISVSFIKEDILITPITTTLMAVGESTGALNAAINRARDLYLEELNLGIAE